MKKIYQFFAIIGGIIAIQLVGINILSASENPIKPLVILPEVAQVKIGTNFDFKAVYHAGTSSEVRVENDALWSVVPDSLGRFERSVFIPKKSGYGIVIARYRDFVDTSKIYVTSTPPVPDSIVFKPFISFKTVPTTHLKVGANFKINAVYHPTKTTESDSALVWATTPAAVGKITGNGYFTALAPGICEVVVSRGDVRASIKIFIDPNTIPDSTVFKPFISFKTTPTTHLKVGDNFKIIAVYHPTKTTESDSALVWTTFPAAVGKITGNGYFTALAPGVCEVVVSRGDVRSSIKIYIDPNTIPDSTVFKPFISFKTTPTTHLKVGDNFKIIAVYHPTKTTESDSAMVWTTFPAAVGKITGNGYFTALAPGVCEVVVSRGDVRAGLRITIDSGTIPDVKKYPKIVFTPEIVKIEVGKTIKVNAKYIAAADSIIPTTFTWKVIPEVLGTINAEGNFKGLFPGNGFIIATGNGLTDSVRLMVFKSKVDTLNIVRYLKIAIPSMKLFVGDSMEMVALLYTKENIKERVAATWSVSPANLGHIVNGIFKADKAGRCEITATFDSLIAKVVFEIANKPVPPKKIIITPSDTMLNVGSTLQYTVKLEDGSTIASKVNWKLGGNPIGEISSTGLLRVIRPGVGIVTVYAEGCIATSARVVVNEMRDTIERKYAIVVRGLPDGTLLPSRKIFEGESYLFGGLPFPLNILNGGMLHFPIGSLKENIKIFMLLPERASNDSVKVDFPDSIFSGIKFLVTVDEVPVEPYFFEKPLNLSLYYKTEKYERLGITPDEIGMFFDVNGNYQSTGITDIVVDSIQHKLYANVVHFSTLVVMPDQAIMLSKKNLALNNSSRFSNYPNPFSESTELIFNSLNQTKGVLNIINSKGQTVRMIALNNVEKGENKLLFNTTAHGIRLQQGIYFGILHLDGGQPRITKMVIK